MTDTTNNLLAGVALLLSVWADAVQVLATLNVHLPRFYL